MERLSRADRKRLLKDDEAWLNRPLALPPDARALTAHARHLTLMLLDTQKKRRASMAAAYVGQIMDASMIKNARGPAACTKGCFYCCKTYVSATGPEILRLAHALKGKEPKIARVTEAAERSKSIDQHCREIERIICPILEDKACSEYAPRPLVCRAVLSKSLEACLRIFEQNSGEILPYSDNTMDIRTYLVIVLQASLRLAGLPHRHYEMNQALAVALTLPDAEERWLAGDNIFGHIPVDSADNDEPSTFVTLVRRVMAGVQPTL